ncbi:hypothetical protein [Bacillus atrophaeus]|nr:hypothetical protein [Bacillus atrophaeus]
MSLKRLKQKMAQKTFDNAAKEIKAIKTVQDAYNMKSDIEKRQ